MLNTTVEMFTYQSRLQNSDDKIIYPHPVYGDVTVKFAADAPFEMPKSIKGGSGATEAFSVVLVEQPL